MVHFVISDTFHVPQWPDVVQTMPLQAPVEGTIEYAHILYVCEISYLITSLLHIYMNMSDALHSAGSQGQSKRMTTVLVFACAVFVTAFINQWTA